MTVLQTKEQIDAILYEAGLERPEDRSAREQKAGQVPVNGSTGQESLQSNFKDSGEMMEW